MDSKFRGLLTDELIAEVKAITPTEREAMLLKSLDESDVTKFTPEDKLLEEETSSQPVVAEEEKVAEPEPEKVAEAEEDKPEPVAEPEPASEPEPVVAAEPEVNEEETPSADEKDKPIVVALTNDLSDGKRAAEESIKKETEEPGNGKVFVRAINYLGGDIEEREVELKKQVAEEKEVSSPLKKEQWVEESKFEKTVAPAVEEKEAVESEPVEEVKEIEEPASEEVEETEEVEESEKVEESEDAEEVEEVDETEGTEEFEETEETEEKKRKLKIRGSISQAVGQAGRSKVLGKFEVFPEDDEFKYRLKANNGEILVVSYGYSTREGAHDGIVTLKKNLESGMVAYITDKNGRSQWRLSTSNDARIVALGETYASLSSAQKAFTSAQKFSKVNRIVDLDEIPAKERRTWEFTAEEMEEKDSGTIEIFDDNGKFRARLLANNQEVLFVTAQAYSSKATLKAALDNIKEKLGPKAFHLSRDKQDQYQFIMESGSGFVYLVGESYSTGASAKSAAASVLSFIRKAEVVDLTLKSANVDVELTGVKK